MKTNKIKISFSNKLNIHLICSILLLASYPVLSNNTIETYGLFIKPKSCVIESKGHHCEETVEVEWKIKKQRDVCLFIENQARELACWQDSTFINQSFAIEIKSNTRFQLRDKTTNQIIYSVPFSLYLKLVKYRKKRRNPWSFY